MKGTEKPAEQVKPTERKTTATPTTDPKKGQAEETAVVAKEAPKVDQRAIFGGGGQSGSANRASSASGAGTDNQAGSAGRAEGTVDGRALMGSGTGQGNPGPASGYNLDLAGWDFASKPDISDRVSTRNGRIVFSITVDDSGKVVQAIPLEYNVSNEVLAYYRTVVNKVSFRRQAGAASADFSTGKITFIIKVD
ncbi:hypothetical protein A3SI_17709 [Nitritalea halalkaliphila LW7]|uniref:TonB family protein n=1 Tax=Nitritalea halalkaliphila LW7 TaxID=1189621 RepID=I5BVM3_9BACT|nr:hypothetical protein [Nitritalea halalkaliphila]EIM73625.1 hypothetical protein A3SI_17709 [Nitritalea halalkaliphila LW7]